jgi:hypothetical protein
MLKRCFFLLVISLLFITAQPATSATSTSDEAIEELLNAMNTIQNIGASLDTMEETIKVNSPYFIKEIKIIMAREIEDDKVQKAAEIYRQDDFGATRLYELFRYKLNLDRIIKEVMLPVYKEHYTTAEIEELTKFYKSDLGQKTLKLNSIISRAISSKTRDISQMALNQAKEELAFELQQKVEK